FVFFFRAEDGIRDFHVTGVQTCALPILVAKLRVPWAGSGCRRDEWRPIAPSAVMLGPNAMYRLQAVTAHPCDPEPICRSSTAPRSEEHTSELQSREKLVCRLLLEKKKHC